MVAGVELLVGAVVSLADILASPEDPVRPGWSPAFLAGVPVVGAEVVFVCRSEPEPVWSTSMSRTLPRNCFASNLMP